MNASDRGRPPVDLAALRQLVAPAWSMQVVEQTESTNADLVAAAARLPSGSVLVAELQHAGRGRLQRAWTSPARAGLTFSVLLRPTPPVSAWGWLPLLTGVALHDAVAETSDVAVQLKWPNDLLAGSRERKLAGILAQVAGDAVVLGIGLNVTTTAAELPVEQATSLAEEGAGYFDRTALLAGILRHLGRRYGAWQSAGGDASAAGLAADYVQRCASVGREVAVTVAGSVPLRGSVQGIDADGRLVLRTRDGEVRLAAGDVEHVRAAE